MVVLDGLNSRNTFSILPLDYSLQKAFNLLIPIPPLLKVNDAQQIHVRSEDFVGVKLPRGKDVALFILALGIRSRAAVGGRAVALGVGWPRGGGWIAIAKTLLARRIDGR